MLFYLLFLPFVGAETLRVMTFNMWISGNNVENGLLKIAKHILLVNPDVVALQEVESVDVLSNLTLMLGPDWTHFSDVNNSYPDTGILTRHTLHKHSFARTNWTVGVKITLKTGEMFNFWAAHLDYKSYGPYAAYNRMATDMAQIMAGEKPRYKPGRWHNAMEVKENPKMQHWVEKADSVPIFFAGDFNCPSHLDWGEDTKRLHGGWTVTWPATKILADMGFKDSFRELYPDPVKDPGFTWSTVNKFNPEWDFTIPEPQDRIDFIMFMGNVTPVKSFTYSGSEPLLPIPNHRKNDYPSDHFAVVTDFALADD